MDRDCAGVRDRACLLLARRAPAPGLGRAELPGDRDRDRRQGVVHPVRLLQPADLWLSLAAERTAAPCARHRCAVGAADLRGAARAAPWRGPVRAPCPDGALPGALPTRVRGA